MKILYHHRTASRDGQSVHIDEMIEAMRQLGHEVIVVAPGNHSAQVFGGSVGWVDRIRSQFPKTIYEFLELAYSLVAYHRLVKVIKSTRPDAIYERYNLFLLAGFWAKRRFKLPLLLEVNAPLAEERATYGGLAQPRLAQWAQRLVWRGADGVLPVTQVLASHAERAGVSADRIEVIPNGINQRHFEIRLEHAEAKRKLGLDGRMVLGFTGFVRDWHGLNRVVSWMAKQIQTDPSLFLLIVGDGPERTSLEAQARLLGIADKIRFTGVASREAIPLMISAFDIALQPAVVHYASPLKLFEYLALGRAIVAPRQPNLEEVLRDGENALLFDASQPGEFEAALRRLVSDPALRQRLGQGAKETIDKGGYTWANNARRVVGLFEELLREQHSTDSVACVSQGRRTRH